MGVVYRARDTRLGRAVAIKLLRPEAVDDPERTRRFLQEARAVSALNHPHIVTVHDIGEDPVRGTWIAMELVEGETLRQRLEGAAFRSGRRCASRSRSPAASLRPTKPGSFTAT
jgi:serine/threonine protein kinase